MDKVKKPNPVKSYMVITAVAKDNPNLFNELSELISETGCNVDDGHMALMGKAATSMLLLSGHWNNIAKLEAQLPSFGRKLGIQINFQRTEIARKERQQMPYLVQIVAADRPGIVFDLTNFFYEQKISVFGIDVETYTGSRSNTQMLQLAMSVNIPVDAPLPDLRDDFIEYCDELNLDAIIEPERQ